MFGIASRILLAFCISTVCAMTVPVFAKPLRNVTETNFQIQTAGMAQPQATVENLLVLNTVVSTVGASKPGHPTYAMLLAALALMAVIAIRRYHTGRR